MSVTCRHFRGHVREGECGVGHPIRKIVMAANGGRLEGLARMFPCRPTPERRADCPSYDPRTAAELAEGQARVEAEMDALVAVLPAVMAAKQDMIKAGDRERLVRCPWCGADDKLLMRCNLQGNRHVNCRCLSCGAGFME